MSLARLGRSVLRFMCLFGLGVLFIWVFVHLPLWHRRLLWALYYLLFLHGLSCLLVLYSPFGRRHLVIYSPFGRRRLFIGICLILLWICCMLFFVVPVAAIFLVFSPFSRPCAFVRHALMSVTPILFTPLCPLRSSTYARHALCPHAHYVTLL